MEVYRPDGVKSVAAHDGNATSFYRIEAVLAGATDIWLCFGQGVVQRHDALHWSLSRRNSRNRGRGGSEIGGAARQKSNAV
jgi:hypothetical protein